MAQLEINLPIWGQLLLMVFLLVVLVILAKAENTITFKFKDEPADNHAQPQERF